MLEIPSYSDELPFIGPPVTDYEMAEALDAQTIQEVHLSKDELEVAIGLYMAQNTKSGQWMLKDGERDRPLAMLREQTGGQVDGYIRVAVNQAVDNGLIEPKFTQTKRHLRLSNLRLTAAGRQHYEAQVAYDPALAARIKACQLAYIHKTIVFVRQEVDNELDELGIPIQDDPTEFVRLNTLDDVSKAKAYLSHLREVQRDLLEKIDAQDRQRLFLQNFKLPKAA